MPRLQRAAGAGFRLRDVPGLWMGPLRMITPVVRPSRASRAVPASYAAWRELGTRPARGDPALATRFISVPPRAILNNPTVTGMGFWSINPYIGCEFGCAYCYARDTHRWTVERGANRRDAPASAREAATLPSSEAFERRILIKEGAAEILMRTLDPDKLGEDAIVIGTATDPYQPAERKFGLTRALLTALHRWDGLRIHIITKSTLVCRDAALLESLGRRHAVSVNISLGSVDAPLLRRLERRTPVPSARLRAMRCLADAGVRVGLIAAPILPGLTDGRDALRKLLIAAQAHGASWANCHPLRMGSATRSSLIRWLERHRPDLARRYARHYGSGLLVSKDYARQLDERFATLRNAVGIPQRERWDVPGGQIDIFG